MSNFEAWATAEIARLRGEADQLEKTLKKFRSAAGRAAHAQPANGVRVTGVTPTAMVPARASPKFGPILDAIKASGAVGLSIEQMASTAQAAGISIARNSLRSMVWHKKKAGELVQLATGNYAMAGQAVAENESPDAVEASGTIN